MNKKVSFAVKGMVFNNSSFLIVKRNNTNEDIWELPGGHLEYGETAAETIIREMKEETGLNVKPVKLLDTWDSFLPKWQITGIIYKCEIKNGEITLSDEHCDYKWIKKDSEEFDILHPVFKERMRNWDWTAIIEN